MIDWITNLFAALYHWASDGMFVFYNWIHDNMTLATILSFFLPLAIWVLCQMLRRLRSYITLRNVLFVSVTVTAFLFCLSFYKEEFTVSEDSTNWISAVLMSFQHALRLFALDGDFGGVIKHLQTTYAEASQYYAAFGALLCFLAPLLTFTLLLSFLKNFSAKVYYTVHFLRSTHVFSELNEKSLAMAKSLAEHHKVQFNDAVYRCWIVLTKPLHRRTKEESKQTDAALAKKTNQKQTKKQKPEKDKEEEDKLVIPPLPEKPRRNTRAYLILSVLFAPLRFFTRPLIVFTDVLDKHEEEHYELISEARRINALLFRKDLGSIHFRFRFSIWRHLSFYLISEDEPEKIRHATHIISRFDYRNARLYVFSDNVECQLLLSPVETKHLTVKRINDIQALIYHNLDLYGLRLFLHAQEEFSKEQKQKAEAAYAEASKSAAQADHAETPETIKDNRPTITAVVVGLGLYGMEMLRALFWYCQSIGSQFRVDIYAFDEREDVASRLYALCPDLDRTRKNKPKKGDNQCEEDFYPTIYGGIKVDSSKFRDEIQKIEKANLVFVGLGTDELNISTAIQIRSIYESMGRKPDIETVVYDSNISKRMSVKWILPREEKEETAGSRFKEILRNSFGKIQEKLFKKQRRNLKAEDPVDTAQKQADEEGGIRNNKNQPYNIHMIGDLESFYSAVTLLHSELDREGELCELRWTTAGLINRHEEKLALKGIIEYLEKLPHTFDTENDLLFIPKTQETCVEPEKIVVKKVNIKQAFEGTLSDNVVSAQSRSHLRAGLQKRVREMLNLSEDQDFPGNVFELFQANRDETKLVFLREDLVSEDAVYEEVSPDIKTPLLPDSSTHSPIQKLAALWNRLRGREDPRLAELKKQKAQTIAQKLYCVERDIKNFSKEIRTGRSPGFRTVEYNYRSSISRAMRNNLRKKGLPANSAVKINLTENNQWSSTEISMLEAVIDKPPQSWNLEEMRIMGKLEHPSWNAYMRTEGFTQAKETNMLAKKHKCLIETSALSAKDLRKDA